MPSSSDESEERASLLRSPEALREQITESGELILELAMPDGRHASASILREDGDWIKALIGMTPSRVRKVLVEALRLRLGGKLPAVNLSMPCPTETKPLLFVSLYVYGEESVRAGAVWFDVEAGGTGPTSTPPEVRSEMRLAVNRILAPQSASSAVVEKFLQWDAAHKERMDDSGEGSPDE